MKTLARRDHFGKRTRNVRDRQDLVKLVKRIRDNMERLELMNARYSSTSA